VLFGHSQLTRRHRAGDGYFSDHGLTGIVRLMIETDILTGMYSLDSGCNTHCILSATNWVITLLMAAILPVRDFRCHSSVTEPLHRHRTRNGSLGRKLNSPLSPSHYLMTASQSRYHWEAVCSSLLHIFHSADTRQALVLHRYSNTLLGSLNNRISIRETSTGREAIYLARSQAITFPSTNTSRVFQKAEEVEPEKTPHAFNGLMPSAVGQGQERVLGEC
jgi:hypothetical protein